MSEYRPIVATGPSAAFFDLDRTLIAGSSVFVVATTARSAGLIRTRQFAKDAASAIDKRPHPTRDAGCFNPDRHGLAATQPIRIDGVADHAAIARAPNSDKPAIVRLRALGASGDVLWLVNGKLEGQTRGGGAFEHAFAETGDATITALAASGNYAQLEVRVLR